MIWCVEDDASIRDIEVYALRSTGFEACGFADGAAFWQALQTEEQPELVVLDVMLPGVDGMELLRRMRASAALRRQGGAAALPDGTGAGAAGRGHRAAPGGTHRHGGGSAGGADV